MVRTGSGPIDPDAAPLRRLGSGRWRTRDDRFTVEQQSGSWVVIDGNQTDELGLPLVRGPFRSLAIAKLAIADARTRAPATSPLAARIERRQHQSASGREPAPGGAPTVARRLGLPAGRTRATIVQESRRVAVTPPSNGGAPREPAWLTDLQPARRGRARRLMAQLASDGIPDVEGLVRRDLIGDVPALAGHAIARRLAELDADATPSDVAGLLADGRDDALGVRWRLVDGAGRPIVLEPAGPRRR